MKTKEEKCEEKLMKTAKKHKKGQTSLPENMNCALDDGGLVEVKKGKTKTKKVETVVIKEESCVGGGEKEEKKEKKGRKIINGSLNDANGSDAIDGNDKGVTKKKKKKLSHDEDQVETAHNSVKDEEVEKKQKKEKKAKNKSLPIKQESVKLEKEDKEEQAVKNEVPKKSKKGKNSILVVNNEETEVQVKEKKKKKKEMIVTMDEPTVTENKAKIAENAVKFQAEEEIHEVKVKKKKRQKVKTEDDETEIETPGIKDNNKKSKASSVENDNSMLNKKNKSTKNEVVITEEGQTKVKRGGKKETGGKASEVVSKTEPKKKRKKANPKGEEEELLSMKVKVVPRKDKQSTESPVTVAGNTNSKKTKKKKSSVQVENDVRVGTGEKKKKKIKEEKVEDLQESPQVDVVFLSEKSGNKDEITINQERRWALQMEIDKASQPEKPANASGFGQWSTAQFNSSEQQQKFLRLMGGFKKSFQPASVSTAGTSMAMAKDAQQQLQQNLLGEFERAHSRRMDFSNRGAGLGFTAPSSKKFSIDANARGSIRFDD